MCHSPQVVQMPLGHHGQVQGQHGQPQGQMGTYGRSHGPMVGPAGSRGAGHPLRNSRGTGDGLDQLMMGIGPQGSSSPMRNSLQVGGHSFCVQMWPL